VEPLEGEELEKARRKGLEAANRRRRGKAEEALMEALKRLQARGEAITAKALAREAGVHTTTASRWLQRMRG
jgi:DNA invertase Pin-like site-specific DNA recombinase